MTRVHPYSTFYNGVLMPFMSHIKIRIRIRIRTDLKSEIRIRRMRFSASSVTSLLAMIFTLFILQTILHSVLEKVLTQLKL